MSEEYNPGEVMTLQKLQEKNKELEYIIATLEEDKRLAREEIINLIKQRDSFNSERINLLKEQDKYEEERAYYRNSLMSLEREIAYHTGYIARVRESETIKVNPNELVTVPRNEVSKHTVFKDWGTGEDINGIAPSHNYDRSWWSRK